MFGGPPLLRTRTYTVDLIHFLVLRRIYTVFLCFYSRTTGAARWSGLELPVCGILLASSSPSVAVYSQDGWCLASAFSLRALLPV
jgi:hypothetical protein